MESECDCGGTIGWKVVRAPLGTAIHKGLCDKCNSVYTEYEVPDHKKGKELAKKIGVVKWNDKRLINKNTDTQIGYFRAIQHCSTCHNRIGKKCKCVDCDCIYCKMKRN